MSIDTLHVCMYTPSSAGGHALYTQELLTALAEVGSGRGIAPELVTSEDLAAAHWTSAYPIHPILPRLVPRREYSTALVWAKSRMIHYTRLEQTFLDWLAGRQDLNIIHFQEYTCWLASRHFRELRRRGLAIVLTVHNIFSHLFYNNIHRFIRTHFEKSVFRRCDALLVHSEGLRDALSDYMEGVHPPIHVTPHGVCRAAGRSLRPVRAVDGPRQRLLFFGAIRSNKGLHILLRALELLPQCDLTVAGEPVEPRYFEQVRDLARRLPPGRVELIDRFVSEQETADLFGRSSLVVLPYTSFAAQSGVLQQALTHARPVVASDVGALGESVRRWGVGEVVPPGDERALAWAIEQALDPGRYRAAVESIACIRSELTWTRTAEATIEVYRSIVR
jgi:glycosyltransferase involved in cell wall biosynthesis